MAPSLARASRSVLATAAMALPIVFSSASEGVPAGPRRRATSIRAGPVVLRAVRAGQGPAVVLLHGYGESLLAWRGVFDRLAESADVIAIDLPGFGLSSKPPTGYATDSLAETLLLALDACRVREVVVVGHSLGGGVAVAMAAQAPERVRGLVLLDAAVVAEPWIVRHAREGSAASRSVREAIARYASLRTYLASVHDPKWLAESDSARSYNPAADPAYGIALEAVLREFDFGYLTPTVSAHLTMPVLVLWGEYDPTIPLEVGRAVTAALQDARLDVISRSWHRPHVERPTVVVAEIKRFLRERAADPDPSTH